nr:ribosomal protein L7Ae/L30e/S12e/Gadd45 [Tanacetum cinerariifolium]
MSMEIKLTKDNEFDSVDSSKYRGNRDHTQAVIALMLYCLENGQPFNLPCELVIRENFYSAIGNRDHTQLVIALMLYCLENGQPFNLAYFIIRRMYFFMDRRDKVLPYGMILTRLFKNLKENMVQDSFDERYKHVPWKMSSLKANQPNKPPPKRARNVGKSKSTQLSTSSLTESPPSNNEDLPSTKLSPRSYSMALKDDPNMPKEQRKTRGMFKNLGQALHNFTRMLKNGCRLKPRRARAMSMTIHSSLKSRILEAQCKASKGVNTPAEMLKGLDK